MKKGLVKYFQIEEENSKPTLIGNDDLIVKLDIKKYEFEVLNHPQEFLEGIDIYENTKGVYVVEGGNNANYIIKEITEKESKEILQERIKQHQYWNDYMSGSKNVSSDSVFGPGGEKL